MKKVLLALLIGAASIPVTAQSEIDILHYRFSIEVNDANDSIYGKAEIVFLAKKGTKSLTLDLAGDMFGKQKGMKVLQGYIVDKIPVPDKSYPSFLHTNNQLFIPAKATLLHDDTLTAIVEYKGVPTDGLIISKNKFGSRTFFSDNWPNRAHNWIPCVDDIADKASVEFLVTAPSHYQVISNGVQEEESTLPGNRKLTHYKEDIALPTKIMVIGVADFAVQKAGDLHCVPIESWVYPENKANGFYDYAQAKSILGYYINYIGPYAYKKLANVQSKTIFGGMENASAIFYAESSVTGFRTAEALIAHEIVHQWFGNMATEKSFAHLWLSEGFATYLTHVYLESRYGTDSLNSRMKKDRQDVIAFVKDSKRPVVDSTKDYMQLLNDNSYQKGGWILHMLRRELGDAVFQQAVRTYYATYAGRNAETKDLQKIFETVSGKNLDLFFKQWLFTPENPSLQLNWQYDSKKKETILTIKQLQSTLFNFPLTISWIAQSGASGINNITIDQKEKSYTFPMTEKPRQLVADPFTSLLFEATILEKK